MADAGPVVRVVVTPDRDAYIRLGTAVYWRRAGRVLAPCCGVVLVGVMMTLARGRDGPFPPAAVFGLAVVAAVGVGLPLSVRRQLAANWDRSPELRAERVYELTPAGFGHAADVSAGRVSWPVIRRAGVVAGNVVLFTGQGQMYFLPEPALSDGQREDLDRLLRAHVPGFAGLPARR